MARLLPDGMARLLPDGMARLLPDGMARLLCNREHAVQQGQRRLRKLA
jgi:hypothetical protein